MRRGMWALKWSEMFFTQPSPPDAPCCLQADVFFFDVTDWRQTFDAESLDIVISSISIGIRYSYVSFLWSLLSNILCIHLHVYSFIFEWKGMFHLILLGNCLSSISKGYQGRNSRYEPQKRNWKESCGGMLFPGWFLTACSACSLRTTEP